MTLKVLATVALGAVVVGFAPGASAQVESSGMTEESRSVESKPEPAPAPPAPRTNPAIFGVGVASTIAGGVAIPVGATLILSGLSQSVECLGQCRSSDLTGTVGAVLLASGIVMLAIGIPMIVVGGKRVSKSAGVEPFTVRF